MAATSLEKPEGRKSCRSRHSSQLSRTQSGEENRCPKPADYLTVRKGRGVLTPKGLL